jgi:hypothetical protein
MKTKLSEFNYLPFLRFSLAFIAGIIREELWSCQASFFVFLGLCVILVIF